MCLLPQWFSLCLLPQWYYDVYLKIKTLECVYYLSGFLSMQTFWTQSLRNDGGLSDTTCWTRNLIFKYSKNLFINAAKCSAVLIFPGTFSVNINFPLTCHLIFDTYTEYNIYSKMTKTNFIWISFFLILYEYPFF